MNLGRAALLRGPKEKWKQTSHLETFVCSSERKQPARYNETINLDLRGVEE